MENKTFVLRHTKPPVNRTSGAYVKLTRGHLQQCFRIVDVTRRANHIVKNQGWKVWIFGGTIDSAWQQR